MGVVAAGGSPHRFWGAEANLATAQGNCAAVEGRLVEKDFEFNITAPGRPRVVVLVVKLNGA